MGYIFVGLYFAAFPVIFFSITIPVIYWGMRLFMYMLDERDLGVIGFILYMILAFWGIGVAIAACVYYALSVAPHVPV